MDDKVRSGPKGRTLLAMILAAAALVAGVPGAMALPAEGGKAPNARVEDADGRKLEMKSLRGKPILVLYEDKDSAQQNRAFKDKLAHLAKGARYRRAIALAAIADVSSYDFWPAKGFVKNAIREESRRIGAPIYCDWDGAFRSAYKLRRGVSNVILVGRDGSVLFAAEGPMTPEHQSKLIRLLGELAGG